MKDAIHHLKHTQRKVIQAARKEQLGELVASNHSNLSQNGTSPSKKVKKESTWT